MSEELFDEISKYNYYSPKHSYTEETVTLKKGPWYWQSEITITEIEYSVFMRIIRGED